MYGTIAKNNLGFEGKAGSTFAGSREAENGWIFNVIQCNEQGAWKRDGEASGDAVWRFEINFVERETIISLSLFKYWYGRCVARLGRIDAFVNCILKVFVVSIREAEKMFQLRPWIYFRHLDSSLVPSYLWMRFFVRTLYRFRPKSRYRTSRYFFSFFSSNRYHVCVSRHFFSQ